MKSLTFKTTQSHLKAIINNHNPEQIQSVFANVVYHGLIHSNIMPALMKSLRDSDAPNKLKVAVSKHMPMQWDKKTKAYKFSATRRQKLLTDLALTEESSFEDVVNSLPDIMAKVSNPPVYNRAKLLKQTADKLTKNGEQNADDIMGLVNAMLNSPELMKVVARAIATELDTPEEKAA